MAAKQKEFFNPDFEALVKNENQVPIDVIDDMLVRYPKSKRALVALIRLIEFEKQGNACVDDWECDLSEIVFPEVRKNMVKRDKEVMK